MHSHFQDHGTVGAPAWWPASTRLQPMIAAGWTEPRKTIGMGLPDALRVQTPLQCAQDFGHAVKGNYSPALRHNIVFDFGFWTFMGPVTPFFFPVACFWNENVYSIFIPPLFLKVDKLSLGIHRRLVLGLLTDIKLKGCSSPLHRMASYLHIIYTRTSMYYNHFSMTCNT